MKRYLITLLILLTGILHLAAQDFIELDGKKIPKKELNPYSGLGYEIDLTQPENKPKLKSAGIGKNMKITSQRVFAAKGMKSFLQSTVIERADSARYYLPSSSSDLKFFDENGKLKWEKKLDGKTPRFCYLSPDGKHTIAEITVYTESDSEYGGQNNSLSIFDDKGNTVFEHLTPVKFKISKSRDIVCYQEDEEYTKNKNDLNNFYCTDLKSGNIWHKKFEKAVYYGPFSADGDFIVAESDEYYYLFYRDGKEIFQKHRDEFDGHIDAISNDGKYILSFINGDNETYFAIFNIETKKLQRIKYLDLFNEENKIFNGGNFVKNSFYLLSLTSIIAPETAMIIFHDINGKYLGHKIYYEIPCTFYSPNISLLDDGSFEIYMDGYYLGNLILPNVNTKQYLKN